MRLGVKKASRAAHTVMSDLRVLLRWLCAQPKGMRDKPVCEAERTRFKGNRGMDWLDRDIGIRSQARARENRKSA